MRVVSFVGLVLFALSFLALGTCREVVPEATAPREMNPTVAEEEIQELVSGNTAFALDLYSWLRDIKGNIFFLPYSISLALAMAYAGARGDTAEEMAKVLHFTLPQDKLHPAFDALDLRVREKGEEPLIDLTLATAFWGQLGHRFLGDYLDLLARYYGAELHLLDLQGTPDACRGHINSWAREKTRGRIEEILPPGSINPDTVLILTSAIYFEGTWQWPFDPSLTQEEPFELLDGSEVEVQMMHLKRANLLYTEGELAGVPYQAVELPYMWEELSIVILLPVSRYSGEFGPKQFTAFEEALDQGALRGILEDLEPQPLGVNVALPKFSFSCSYSLKEALSALGMRLAFSPDADFSGIDGRGGIWIDDVYHMTFVKVTEEGTEAAAAAAIPMVIGLPPEVYVDHPFIFLIRERGTGAVLSLGRVTNPTKSGNIGDKIFCQQICCDRTSKPEIPRCGKPAPRTPGATALLPKV